MKIDTYIAIGHALSNEIMRQAMEESEKTKTSAEWIQECNFKVIDPDGWDRENWEFSWYHEEITKDEFMRRCISSTLQHFSPNHKSSMGSEHFASHIDLIDENR